MCGSYVQRGGNGLAHIVAFGVWEIRADAALSILVIGGDAFHGDGAPSR